MADNPDDNRQRIETLDDVGDFPFIPLFFVIFLIIMANLNCYIERRRFENRSR